MFNVYDNGEHLLGRCDKIKKLARYYIKASKRNYERETYKELLKDLEENYKDTDVILVCYNDYSGYFISCMFEDRDVLKDV